MAISHSIGQTEASDRSLRLVNDYFRQLVTAFLNVLDGRGLVDLRNDVADAGRLLEPFDSSGRYGRIPAYFYRSATQFVFTEQFTPTDPECDLFDTSRLSLEKRLALAVLLGDRAGPALADYLQELGVEPDGVGVERERVLGLLKQAKHAAYGGRVGSRDSGQNQWWSGAEMSLQRLEEKVRAGTEPVPTE